MVKKDNKFILYHLKILFIILINIIIFIIPTKTVSASTLPLINVPLDRWIYPAISRLETLQAFEGNSTIALNTTPLTRYEIAYLIDSALSNVSYIIPVCFCHSRGVRESRTFMPTIYKFIWTGRPKKSIGFEL